MMREGYEYYRTPRGQHPRSANWWLFRSIDPLAQYDSYAFINLIAPRPLLMIVGTEADMARFSRKATERFSGPKELYLIDGATHIDLYDREEFVPQAITKLKASSILRPAPSRLRPLERRGSMSRPCALLLYRTDVRLSADTFAL
jgi:fermentation-respiration switch protein FrsA (DUF1100 family)